jgi:hypothetical protein
MQKAAFFAVALLLGSSLGCGPTATDTSNVPPPPTQEETTQEIEKAVESGKIEPGSYGKY